MPKNFKEASEQSAGRMKETANGAPAEPAPEPVNTQATKGTKNSAPGYYRFSLSMPLEYENYLKTAAYNASSPGHIVSITAYINELIRQDMERAQKKNLDDAGEKKGKE